MTIRDSILAGTRAALDALGEAWTYRALTSEPDGEVPTWGSAAALSPVHFVGRTTTQDFDERRGGFVRREVASIRVYSSVSLREGDQVIDTASLKWHVDGVASEGVGVRRYSITRELPLVGSADRGGGV